MFWGIKSISHKSRVFGFSSLEMMVAIGILATIFILAMPFFSQQGKIVKQLRTSANCQAILDTAFSRINSFGDSLGGYQAKVNPSAAAVNGTTAYSSKIFAFIPPHVGAATSPYANQYDPDFAAQREAIFANTSGTLYSENGSKTIQLPPQSNPISQVIANDGVTLFTPLLLKGSMEYLATKYNSGYCNTYAPVSLLTSLDKDSLNNLYQGGFKDLKLDLKVNRYDLGTNQLSSATCGLYWPRPRNGGHTDITYEPQFGQAGNRQIIGQFPSWIQDSDGLRATLRASYTNDKGQTEDCEGTKDFSLPEDKQNVIDYFYDVSFVKASAMDTSKIIDNVSTTNGMRQGTTCNGASCLGHDFETILTNLQPNKGQADWPENRDRPECSQTPDKYMDLVVTLRVYNTQKEPGFVAMCMDTSNQWFKNTTGNWCPAAANVGNKGVETSFDKSWNMRYTGWVPCEHMMFCNSRPDRVEIKQSTATNSKFSAIGASQPYVEYKYYYNKITGDKNVSRMWGCEMKFGVSILDMAGNLSYVPAKEAMQSAADANMLVPNDKRPPIKEINPHVYFKPPPCYVCNCKPCKGGKGLFGGLFNWVLFVVLVVVSGGLFGVIGAVIVGTMCLNGALGCYSGGGTNYVPDSSGGKYRSCNDSDETNQCKCGHTCNAVRPPAPSWSSNLEGDDITALEANSCLPGSTFYNNGVAANNVGGMTPWLGYKVSKGASGGFDYMGIAPNGTPDQYKVQPGDEVMWTAFDAANQRFCYVVAHCASGKFVVNKESSQINGDNTQYPLMGCYKVKTGTKIDFPNTTYGIAQGTDKCLEVEFNTGPQNPGGNALWGWSKYNEQCSMTNSAGALSTGYPVVAGNCPQSSPTSSTSTTGATYNATGTGCAKGTSDPTNIDTYNFGCKTTRKYWDACANNANGTGPCYQWCYAECSLPDYIPEHPYMNATAYTGDPNSHNVQRSYDNMTSADASLPFCTMDRKQFDVGY